MILARHQHCEGCGRRVEDVIGDWPKQYMQEVRDARKRVTPPDTLAQALDVIYQDRERELTEHRRTCRECRGVDSRIMSYALAGMGILAAVLLSLFADLPWWTAMLAAVAILIARYFGVKPFIEPCGTGRELASFNPRLIHPRIQIELLDKEEMGAVGDGTPFGDLFKSTEALLARARKSALQLENAIGRPSEQKDALCEARKRVLEEVGSLETALESLRKKRGQVHDLFEVLRDRVRGTEGPVTDYALLAEAAAITHENAVLRAKNEHVLRETGEKILARAGYIREVVNGNLATSGVRVALEASNAENGNINLPVMEAVIGRFVEAELPNVDELPGEDPQRQPGAKRFRALMP
ncbi:MAG: hypothetical protein WCV84_06005 [Patescibacteria group bacterium]